MPDPITITRTERDVILSNLWHWNDDDPVPFNTREEASAALEGLQRTFSVRDELGWTDDDERDTFTTTVERGVLVDLLRTVAQEAAVDKNRDQRSLERAQAGDRGYWFDHCATLEEVVRAHQEEIQRWDHEERVCDDLLARLANGTGDARTAAAEPVAA